MTNADGDTFVRQMKSIKSYAAANGIEIVAGFEEIISGTKEWEHRPAYKQMIESLNGVRTIVVERLDRLARNLMVQEKILQDLRNMGVTLISVAEPDLCSTDPTRTLLRHMIAAISEYERAMIVAKLRDARMRKKQETGSCEGKKPFGHYPGEGDTLNFMVKLRRHGHSYEEIAVQLNDGKYPTRGGGLWYKATIREILLREMRAK